MIITVTTKFILVCDCLVTDKELFIVFILRACNVIVIAQTSTTTMVLTLIANPILNYKDM